MRIAVTGATGMIGSDLIGLASERGDDVIAIVHPDSKRIDNLPKSGNVRIIECDISDYKSLFSKERCDVFYHLAWMKTFGKDRDDVSVQEKNIEYALDAVELADSWGAKVFIGAGSQAEYGLKDVPLNEDVPVNPESGYGIAKYTAGKLCNLLCQQKGIRFNWARILSVYGKLDADHTLIMYIINELIHGRSPELTRCEQTWDYLYSRDCANALLSIGDKGRNGRTYCLGSGQPRPLKEYVETIHQKIDPDILISYGKKEYYPHQVMYLAADIEDLTGDTGWLPEYPFEKGIDKVIEYVRRNRSDKQIV